jgi:DNA-binding NtrC family response regulator
MSGDSRRIFGDDQTVPTLGEEAGSTRLLIVGPEDPVTFPLVEPGTYTIGRSLEADITINDPNLSRLHAVLTFMPQSDTPLRVRDLGSSNGTRLRGRALQGTGDVAFAPGDPIELGRSTLIVQRAKPALEGPRRVWPHSYLELRLEELSARSRKTGEPLSLLRARFLEKPEPKRTEKTLATRLGPDEIIAAYSPLHYDLLLLRNAEQAELAATALRQDLAAASLRAEVGVASFPRDGRAAGELLACLSGRSRARTEPGERGVVVADAAMERIYALAERIADKDISVLILGETGVGKEIMARAIHQGSKRAERLFLALNCGAFTEELLETELFGHERGAFTGAVKEKRGLLETVERGTIFLDEVGEMALGTQVKLLRVIEERQLRRVGGLETIPFEARFIAATNRDLEIAVKQGRFREDLYYRLNGFSLLIPPLRDRTSEILPLARAFAAEAERREGLGGEPRFSEAAEAALLAYAWPGNVRELKNVIERAVVLSSGAEIDVVHLPMEKLNTPLIYASKIEGSSPPREPMIDETENTPIDLTADASLDHREKMASIERQAIMDALERCGGNQTRAAELLGMSRKSLVRRLDSYDIPRPRKGRGE